MEVEDIWPELRDFALNISKSKDQEERDKGKAHVQQHESNDMDTGHVGAAGMNLGGRIWNLERQSARTSGKRMGHIHQHVQREGQGLSIIRSPQRIWEGQGIREK